MQLGGCKKRAFSVKTLLLSVISKAQINSEQTATVQSALLHFIHHGGFECGPRCEPLSGAPFQSRGHITQTK
jgi:hypothetical protein